MLDLNFTVEEAEQQPHAAAPLLIFKLRITELGLRRRADDDPGDRLALSDPHRADPTALCARPNRSDFSTCSASPSAGADAAELRSGPTPASSSPRLPAARSSTCPFRARSTSTSAATKYFHALEDGEVPLCLLFSGTIFYTDDDGYLQVSQIPWEKEATFRLPVRVWKEMIELYYPNCAWLCLGRDAFDRLYRFKTSQGIPTWEQAIETLLDSRAGEGRIMNRAQGRPDRQRRPLRGLHPLSLSPLGEEPPALDVRRAGPAGV